MASKLALSLLLSVLISFLFSHASAARLGSTESCLGRENDCEKGLKCVGLPDKKRCRKPMLAGQKCGVDPFWVCDKDLTCQNRRCKIPEKGICTNRPDFCAFGLECLGTEAKKKCRKRMTAGQKCNVDPSWICEKDLVCENFRCKVPEKGFCTNRPRDCAAGLVCLGSDTKKKCRTPMRAGEKCDTPLRKCGDKLVCEKKRCKIRDSDDCSANPDHCIGGTACVGPPTRRLCKKPKRVGEACGEDEHSFCEGSLVCTAGVCKPPRIPKDGNCSKRPHDCDTGLVCAGKRRKRVCVMPKGPGMPCDEPYWVCQAGLKCVHKYGHSRRTGVCMAPIPENGACDHKTRHLCAHGLVCRWYKCVPMAKW